VNFHWDESNWIEQSQNLSQLDFVDVGWVFAVVHVFERKHEGVRAFCLDGDQVGLLGRVPLSIDELDICNAAERVHFEVHQVADFLDDVLLLDDFLENLFVVVNPDDVDDCVPSEARIVLFLRGHVYNELRRLVRS